MNDWPPEWMNWEGWRWIAPLIGLAQGIAFGWYMRALKARHDALAQVNYSLRRIKEILAADANERHKARAAGGRANGE